METKVEQKILPDIYINTGKATFLAIMKLVEASAACYALWYVITKPRAISDAVNDFYMGFAITANTQSEFSSIFQFLYNFLQLIVIVGLAFIVLDGLASFFTRVAHKGAGIVKFCHMFRYVFSIIAFLLSLAGIVWYFVSMSKIAQATKQLSFSDMFSFLGSYEMIFYIIVILGAFWIMAEYHHCVGIVMSQVSKEIKAGRIQKFGKKNRLGRESAWFVGVLLVSAVLSVIEIVGGSSVVASIASFVKPVEILHRGSNGVSVAVCTALAIKFFIVNRCSSDFDKAH